MPLVTYRTENPTSNDLNRSARRRRLSMLEHRFGTGFLSFRTWQLLVLGSAVGLLMGVASSSAGAAPFGEHAVKARSVHAQSTGSFNVGSWSWQPNHHRWVWSPPAKTSVPPATVPPSVPPTTVKTTVPPATSTTDPTVTTTTQPSPNTAYPDGVPDASEPSGMAPPSASEMSGYTQSYVQDFAGSSLPSGWPTFSGQPGGDPGALWAASHVVVSNGMLQLNAWEDPAYGNKWVAGGTCYCGHSQTYGAFFIRSRVTGAGPTEVNLLWPAAPVWPPEIDFNETNGDTTETSATVHFTSSNQQDQRDLTDIDMTQWHTWGVIWSPSEIVYTVDGRVWGTITKTNEIPNIPMTLDITQQTWCASGWACPTQPESTQVDWVAIYTPQG